MAASMKTKIANYVAGTSDDDALREIASDLNKKSLKFLEFIEGLGEFLTNVDTVVRGRATGLIGHVLNFLPPSFLSSDQVELVATFLIAKLSDHHSVQPQALQTLAILTSRCNSLPSGLPQLICRSIFREVQNQSLSQSDRYATYTVLQNILGYSFPDVEEMGGDFVIGFIQQMDSEKDPRNLMIAFNCAQFISSRLHLGAFTEEMFEVLGCYFPIDFTPPANNPHGITKEDLILALRKCFSATVDFAQHCVPLLVEKMTSDLQSARMDAFLTLTECAPVYGRNGVAEFLGSIVSCVKREVLMNLTAELVETAKACVVAVFTAMTPKEDVNASKDDAVTTSAVELYQDVSKFLEGSDVTKGCLAFSLCRAVASSSPLAFCAMTPLVLPVLILQVKNQSQVSVQHSYLMELSGFAQQIVKFSTNSESAKSVSEYIGPVCDVFEELLATNAQELQSQAAQSLSTLCKTEQFGISQEKCVSYLKLMATRAMHTVDTAQRKLYLSSVHEVLKQRPNARPDITELTKAAIKSGEASYAQEVLVATVTDVNSFTDVNNFFLKHISQAGTDIADVSGHAESVRELLSQHVSDPEVMAVVLEQLAFPVVMSVVTHSCQWKDDDKEKVSQLLTVVSNILKILGYSMQKGDVTKLWDALQKFYLLGDAHAIGLSGDFPALTPLQPKSPWQQTRLIALLEGFVEGVNIQWTVENREAVFESAFGFALSCEDEFSHIAACKIVASMVNKAPLGAQIHWLLEPVMEKSKSAMSSNSGQSASCLRALTLWIWLTKAMECRSHSAAALFSSHLVSVVGDPNLGPAAARGLGHVVQDGDDIFTTKLNGSTTPLYKQRFFTLNFKHLLEGYEQAKSQEVKQNYLTAICLLTSHLPLQVLKPHLSKLVPLLLSSLEQAGGQAHSQTLLTLGAAVSSTPDVITPHLDSVVPNLLQIAQRNQSMRVRISALECLENLTNLQMLALAPYEKRVVRELGPVLDDRKRLVRKRAVEARAAWISLENASKP
ncbi:MMS19 nucleotide excision repair protein homolog [Aplysia californica]|uniref:MMS19 nucleotide excision repair protein n=1 Tax=Aplysia californica TaxID=6500 RepID=A0ABM0JXB3_APLCA|nr:MMS19 nucleotide excision repair protein homolog [Aplysia californica]